MATSSIGTVGRDYSTIAAWEAALPATLSEPEIGEVYDDGGGDTFGEVIFAGCTTTSANYIRLISADGHSHDGQAGSSWRIESNANWQSAIATQEPYVEFVYVEMGRGTSPGGNNIGNLHIQSQCSGIVVSGCIINNRAEGGGRSGEPAISFNGSPLGNAENPCIISNTMINWGYEDGNMFCTQAGWSATPRLGFLKVLNCTFVNVSGSTGTAFGLDFQNANYTVKVLNTIVRSTDDWNGAPTDNNSSGNISRNGQVYGDSATLYEYTSSLSPGAGDWWIAEDLAAIPMDLRLVNNANNDVLTLGIGPDADADCPVQDIAGNPRSGTTCDPGAFEATPAAEEAARRVLIV